MLVHASSLLLAVADALYLAAFLLPVHVVVLAQADWCGEEHPIATNEFPMLPVQVACGEDRESVPGFGLAQLLDPDFLAVEDCKHSPSRPGLDPGPARPVGPSRYTWFNHSLARQKSMAAAQLESQLKWSLNAWWSAKISVLVEDGATTLWRPREPNI